MNLSKATAGILSLVTDWTRTNGEIAKSAGVSHTTVALYRRARGIKPLSKGKRAKHTK